MSAHVLLDPTGEREAAKRGNASRLGALAQARIGLLDIFLQVFVVAAVTINLAMALIARVAPAIQVFFVAAPGQILAGIALLSLVAPALLASFHEALQAGWSNLPGLR